MVLVTDPTRPGLNSQDRTKGNESSLIDTSAVVSPDPTLRNKEEILADLLRINNQHLSFITGEDVQETDIEIKEI